MRDYSLEDMDEVFRGEEIFCPFCERTYPLGTKLKDDRCCVSVEPIIRRKKKR